MSARHTPQPDLEHPRADRTLVSEWGVTYRQAEGFGAPYTPVSHPLADATSDEASVLTGSQILGGNRCYRDSLPRPLL